MTYIVMFGFRAKQCNSMQEAKDFICTRKLPRWRIGIYQNGRLVAKITK